MTYKPRYTNLVELFRTATQKYANKPLFGTRKPSGWHWTSYAEFARMVDGARAALASMGVERGDRVAIIANNRLEWAVCAYATYTRAAVYVPMYEAQLDKDWHYILRDSGAKVCFVSNDAVERRVRGLQADLPSLVHVINLEGPRYGELLDKTAAVPSTSPADDDIAKLIYTSGTTGMPKGVCLTHRNLAANVSGVLDVAPVREGDRSVAFLPWAHVFGGAIELNAIIALGGMIAICGNTEKLIEYLPEVRPTMLFAVPRIWNKIYDGVQKQVAGRPKAIQALFHTGLRAKRKQKLGQALSLGERLALPLAQKLIFSKVVARFGGELRFAFSGAAALSREVAEFIDDLGIQVYEGYGMTESSGATTANAPECRIGSVGKPIPGVSVKLDPRAVGAGEGEGEVLIYGTGVMAGYYNQPQATAEAMTEDGGLRSGDLGRFDADGFLYITGRVKELYKLENGRYVAPAPLEEKLQLSPFISQILVYGSDRPHNVALVVPEMGALQSWAEGEGLPREPEALLAHERTRELVRKEIDHHSREFKGYEAIRAFVLSPEELTTQNDMLTPTLKLKRRNVVAKYGPQLDALYTGTGR
jgi:long-chain acyl-CoA synthetase